MSNWAFIWAGYAVALGATAALVAQTIYEWRRVKPKADDEA